MANKRAREENVKRDKERRYELAKKEIYPLEIVACIIAVIVVLLFFLNWAYVNNTDVGVEVKVSGFNAFIAGITGDYSSPSSEVGDMAIPFYMYAKSYSESLGLLTVVALFSAAATLVLGVINAVFALLKKNRILNYPLAATSLVTAVLLILCFITALSMKDAQILSVYCGGNVKCSIGSLAVIPAVLSVAVTVLAVLQIVKSVKIKKILK